MIAITCSPAELRALVKLLDGYRLSDAEDWAIAQLLYAGPYTGAIRPIERDSR